MGARPVALFWLLFVENQTVFFLADDESNARDDSLSVKSVRTARFVDVLRPCSFSPPESSALLSSAL